MFNDTFDPPTYPGFKRREFLKCMNKRWNYIEICARKKIKINTKNLTSN